MIYQIIIAIGLILLTVNVILNLRSLRTPSKRARVPDPAPLVSVLVPARNEEENIATCVKSLQKQDYPNFEIVVLDDNSTDRTSEIVETLVANDSRVRLIKGQFLPEGWAGKPFACHQLAQEAKGDYFLFVDADTIHAPHMLRSTLALAIEMKASLLSGFPRQLTTGLPQKIAIPIPFYFVIVSLLPLWWLHRSKKPRPSLAVGQFFLFPKEEYWRVGGHRAVKSRILEDIWMAFEIVRHGGRHVAVNLVPVVCTNMYCSVGTMWEGFIKWIYSVGSLSPAALIGLAVAGYCFFLAPFYWLWHDFVMAVPPTEWRFIIAFQVALIFFMRILADSYFKSSVISIPLHPLGIAFMFAAAIYGGWRQALHKGIEWKDRTYEEASGVK
ncbi:MAG: glycosyltransferase [Chloroflexi bacterium]|nr:glycosyltransferase [Chloroflexota bacterium]MBM3166347.1 glycosyltransferase [Chloroflexota bacterium]MBM3172794.1 glycosyltransferase [Chloroflexota bacterium]MBM4451968.1 glycosyltransferase [Chloroflexota bacterium]